MISNIYIYVFFVYIIYTLNSENMETHSRHDTTVGRISSSHNPLRPWQYNNDVSEFYVVLQDKTLLKKADTTREKEETDLGAPWPHSFQYPPTTRLDVPTNLWFGCLIMYLIIML